MTNDLRKLYEQEDAKGGRYAVAANEAYAAIGRIAATHGLRVDNADMAERLVTSIFEFLLDSNSDDRRPIRFRLVPHIDGGTVLRLVK